MTFVKMECGCLHYRDNEFVWIVCESCGDEHE